jgi:ligand-binding SRPBCC domain-containing protein
MSTFSFEIVSRLRAPVGRVWTHASNFAEINRELWPLAQMTYPHDLAHLSPATFPLGRQAFRSWILLFGLVPVDFDDITLVELEPDRGFYEVSRLLTMGEWRHRRTLSPTTEGCAVKDAVTCIPRWGWTGRWLVWLYRLAFEHRHRNLRRLFGTAPK